MQEYYSLTPALSGYGLMGCFCGPANCAIEHMVLLYLLLVQAAYLREN